MRSLEDKGCLNYVPKQEISSSKNVNFEFYKGNRANRTPSKWDDAQKWLVNLSRGEKNQSKTNPRNSNSDDRRLIAPVSKEENYLSDEDHEEGNLYPWSGSTIKFKVETKKLGHNESIWRINNASESSASAVRSISVRDKGTEMTPIASQEPSRTATPIRTTTPTTRSPISSGFSTPVRFQNGFQPLKTRNQTGIECRGEGNRGNDVIIRNFDQNGQESNARNTSENNNSDQTRKLENRAMAWDEAKRVKYMARFRYKREEVKIKAWENHEKRKAEMQMRKKEVKAERLKSRAQERYTNKLAATRRIAEEKHANAEAKLNEKALKTSARADYIRRTGHLPSSFSFKLPSCCW